MWKYSLSYLYWRIEYLWYQHKEEKKIILKNLDLIRQFDTIVTLKSDRIYDPQIFTKVRKSTEKPPRVKIIYGAKIEQHHNSRVINIRFYRKNFLCALSCLQKLLRNKETEWNIDESGLKPLVFLNDKSLEYSEVEKLIYKRNWLGSSVLYNLMLNLEVQNTHTLTIEFPDTPNYKRLLHKFKKFLIYFKEKKNKNLRIIRDEEELRWLHLNLGLVEKVSPFLKEY